jgi:3-deoxy-manno-octulosonate cytidylyltransferase (CMP-KDO synthetase)
MIQWVYERVSKASLLEAVVVATDDERIAEVVNKFGGKVAMTRADHLTGTDRVAEAAAGFKPEIVVNIQGDEPTIHPALIDQLTAVLTDHPDWEMSTAAVVISDPGQVSNPSVVKVVTDHSGRAMYFSRSAIPFIRDDSTRAGVNLFKRHLGIYAYRYSYLTRLVTLPESELEHIEKLEQLRALQDGAQIGVVIAEEQGVAVDTPEDVPYAERAIQALQD